MGRTFTSILASVVVAAVAVSAHGAVIGISNTGIGTPGTVDPNYTVIVSSDLGHPGPAAFVTTATTGTYLLNNATSKWVDLVPDTNTNLDPGLYEFQTTFDLTGLDPSTASLSGRWASDNAANMVLNGVSTGNSLGGSSYSFFTNFSVSTGFVAGVNTLDFFVTNDSGPSALRVEVAGTAASNGSVPEPASLALLAMGALAVLRVNRKKNA